MNVKRLGALFVAALLVTAAVPAFAASDATVGEFVIKLAKARNLAATDARVAVDALRGIGVRVPADLNYSKRLTEGDVARLSRVFGLNVDGRVASAEAGRRSASSPLQRAAIVSFSPPAPQAFRASFR